MSDTLGSMSFEDIRPILTGIVGAVCGVALSYALSRWIPKGFSGKSAETLVRENRVAIRVANGVFIAGVVGMLALYQWAGFAENDWRPFGLGFGFALSAPLATLPLVAYVVGGSPREALIAYAMAQRMPRGNSQTREPPVGSQNSKDAFRHIRTDY